MGHGSHVEYNSQPLRLKLSKLLADVDSMRRLLLTNSTVPSSTKKDFSIWKHTRELRHDNRSNRLEDFRLYYDDESRSTVKWWFMRDIKEFNYTFF